MKQDINYTWKIANDGEFIDIHNKNERVASINMIAFEEIGLTWQEAVKEAVLICEAVNNYSKLKEINKELVETCGSLINQMKSLEMNQPSLKLGWSNEKINMWSASLLIADKALQKAKQ